MKCNNCGNEINSGQRFCSYCGAEQSQQKEAQEQSPVPPSFSFDNTGKGNSADSNEKKMFLTAFSAICGAVYGLSTIGGLFGLLGSLMLGYGLTRHDIPLIFLWGFLDALNLITGVWICLFLILMAFRWTREHSDGLLLCICGGGVMRIAVQLLKSVTMKISYDVDGIVVHYMLPASAGIAITVGGIYLILRFLLGENPIFGKTAQELQENLKAVFDNLSETIRRGNAGNARVMQPQGQTMQNNQTIGNIKQVPNGQFGSYGQMSSNDSALLRLKTDRSLVLYIVLNIVTCGIYGCYFIHALARDMNVACSGDGKKTGGLLQYILLSLITCGIYRWVWYYGVGNRLASNSLRYGMSFQENGTTILLWKLFGVLLCGIGPFIALHIIIKNTNMLCGAYNHIHNM